jgi:arsenite-transporting ATPase
MKALNNVLMRLHEQIFWTQPLLDKEPRGNLLNNFWSALHLLDKRDVMISNSRYKLPLPVDNPVQLPAYTSRLLISAGKGGVGNTTFACATTFRLNSEYPQLRILLFSTDPAHSLSDCLGISVQSTPTSVIDRIDAQEINAEADFDKVRNDYRAELESFLEEALPNLDITFDREVMEHLLDLAPPGLDEIMALTTIMDHLGSGRYDMIVIDAAPSGHLLRLLELPNLIRDWLKIFFSLLLKYRKVMRLPHLSERLVKLSRELKSLLVLLQDIDQTRLYAVTIPTHLAIEKTSELIAGLQKLRITLQAVFINQITPASDCDLCQSIVNREAVQLKKAYKEFPKLPLALVFRQNDPSGLAELTTLGSALYV